MDINWIGKKLKYKSGPDTTYEVIDQKVDGTVILNNNGRVAKDKINELFVEVNNSNTLNPDTFFDRSLSSLHNSFQNQVSNPNFSKSIGDTNNYNIEHPLDNNGVIQMKLFNGDPQPIKVQPQNTYVNNHGLVDEEEEVRRVYGESMKDVVGEDEFNKVNYGFQNTQFIQRQSEANSPISNQFKNMKRTTPIKFRLDINEMIPKIEAIRNLNDLFEDSIIEHLAKEMARKYTSNPQLLEELFIEKLESIIFPNKKKKSKKKVAKKRPSLKKPTSRAKKPTESVEEDKNDMLNNENYL